jgi:hypothetical protein
MTVCVHLMKEWSMKKLMGMILVVALAAVSTGCGEPAAPPAKKMPPAPTPGKGSGPLPSTPMPNSGSKPGDEKPTDEKPTDETPAEENK